MPPKKQSTNDAEIELPAWHIISKGIKVDAKHNWRQDEVTVIFWWMKQLIGLILGLIFGIAPVTGWHGIFFYMLLQWVIAYYWANEVGALYITVQSLDAFSNGLPTGFIVFLVTWICSFTFFYSTK